MSSYAFENFHTKIISSCYIFSGVSMPVNNFCMKVDYKQEHYFLVVLLIITIKNEIIFMHCYIEADKKYWLFNFVHQRHPL